MQSFVSGLRKGLCGAVLLAGVAAEAQNLKRRAPAMSDRLAEMYDTPEYDAAYRSAQETYRSAKSEPKWVPAPWDSHKQMVWLMGAQRELERFAKRAMLLGLQLDALAQKPETQGNLVKLAAIRQIEDQFTEDCMTDLNEMVLHLDLGGLFRSNKMPDAAAVWIPQTVPHGRNSGKIDLVSGTTRHLVDSLGTTTRTHVVFARSASFNNDPLVDENGKELRRADYLIYWRTDTAAVVQIAMKKLFGNLEQAERAAEDEGLVAGDDHDG